MLAFGHVAGASAQLPEAHPERDAGFDNIIHSSVWWSDDEFDVAHIFLDSPGGDLDFPAYSADRAFFTEIDHRFVNPTSWDYRDRIETPAGFAEGFWVDRAGINAAYPWGYSVFNEYLTWALYDLWARDAYDAATYAAAHADVERIMVEYRGFVHDPAFVEALLRLHDDAVARGGDGPAPIAALYPDLLDWAQHYRAAR